MKDRKWQKEYYFMRTGRKEGKTIKAGRIKKGRKESSSETEQVAYFRQKRDQA